MVVNELTAIARLSIDVIKLAVFEMVVWRMRALRYFELPRTDLVAGITSSLKINARFCQFCSGSRSVWRGHGNALRPSCMHLLRLYRNFGAPQKDNPQPARDNNPRSSRHSSLSKV